jgi:hypothetical protein
MSAPDWAARAEYIIVHVLGCHPDPDDVRDVAAALKEAYEAGERDQHALDLLVLGTAVQRA